MMRRGHDVLAMSDAANMRNTSIKTLHYKFDEPTTPIAVTRLGQQYTKMSNRGLVLAQACKDLYDSYGYAPDVIFGHSGWGETLFLKNIWPKAKLITYSEYYYGSADAEVGFDHEFSSNGLEFHIGAQARASYMADALVHSDAGFCPTQWQASTHPPFLRPLLKVIHDGIDTNIMKPNPEASLTLADGRILRAGDEILTFVNRNLEPYRGYHIFMRSLPEVLKARPNAQVVIIGGDEISYGPTPPGLKGWKDVFLNEVKDKIDLSRVHFLGKVSYRNFVTAMQISRAHVYLTYPFILSWSLLEAMSTACTVIASNTQPLQEVIRNNETGLLVDFFDIKKWSETIIDVLAHPERYEHIGKAARQFVVEKYDLKTVCLPQQVEFLESFDPHKKTSES